MTPLPVAHRLLCPWDSPGKNSGVVTIPFSRGSSQSRRPKPGDGFFTICTIREADVLCCAVFSRPVLYDPSQSHVQQPARLLCSLGFSRQEYWSGLPCPPPTDLPSSGIEPRSPASQANSLLSEPSGKSKNTGVGSLSLLQGIFPTKESNRGLLHCRWSLYQLSYEGRP